MAKTRPPCGKISGRHLNRYKQLIKSFSTCPVNIQETLVANPDLNFIKLICEITLNLLHNSVALSKSCINQLKKFKNLILYFSDRDISLKNKAKKLKSNVNRHRRFLLKIFKCIIQNL